MSYSVVRGKPTAAQLYLDIILDEVLGTKGLKCTDTNRRDVNLSQILLHCLRRRPDHVFMINGSTGETITNKQHLQHSISLARMLLAKGLKGKTIMLMMRNHQYMAAMYCAAIFAGTIPFMMDPNSTAYELSHFLKLIEPYYVFCDEEHREDFHQALQGNKELTPEIHVLDQAHHWEQITAGQSRDYTSFEVPDSDMDSTVMLLPTSGSTGLPKAACMTHRGLVIQLPTIWSYHTQFPCPTSRAMMLTTLQWMTFTMTVTSSITYHITLLMSPRKTSVPHTLEMMETYRPKWTFFSPAFTQGLVTVAKPDHMSSLETLTLVGAPVGLNLITKLQALLPKSAQLCDGYGCTEAMGYVAIPDKEAPPKCNGWIFNFLHYKLVGSDGQTLGLCQKGELYFKGDCVIRGYYKNRDSLAEFSEDEWYKSGDAFYIDENERMFFVERLKFSFKFRGCQVSPEEVEQMINSLAGVQEAVVCATDDGPAAAIVVRQQHTLTREEVHKVVDASLSEHKRLHGGIAFVPSLPHTHSGKIQRHESGKLIHSLKDAGQCY